MNSNSKTLFNKDCSSGFCQIPGERERERVGERERERERERE